jgi:hypothetical protein
MKNERLKHLINLRDRIQKKINEELQRRVVAEHARKVLGFK